MGESTPSKSRKSAMCFALATRASTFFLLSRKLCMTQARFATVFKNSADQRYTLLSLTAFRITFILLCTSAGDIASGGTQENEGNAKCRERQQCVPLVGRIFENSGESCLSHA